MFHDEVVPTKEYCAWTWKLCWNYIKVWRLSIILKCGMCEHFREDMHHAVKNGEKTEYLKERTKLHYDMVEMQRRQYKINRDRSSHSPADFCCIIIDRFDHPAFGISHFMNTTKQIRGHSVKVKLVGVLKNGQANTLRIFKITELKRDRCQPNCWSGAQFLSGPVEA